MRSRRAAPVAAVAAAVLAAAAAAVGITVLAGPSPAAAAPTPRQAAQLRRVVGDLGGVVGEVTTALEVTGCADEAARMVGVEGSAHQVATCRPVPPSSADFPRFARNPDPAGFGSQLAALSADLPSLPAAARWPAAFRGPLATLGRDGRLLARGLAAAAGPAGTPWWRPVRHALEQLDAATGALRRALRHLTPG